MGVGGRACEPHPIMTSIPRHRLAACIAAGFLPALAAAQTAPSAPAAEAETTIVVTGNPLGRDTLTQPASSLAGDGLLQRRAGTLGDTVDGLPGAAASRFGPNSSRPVIRGLDGDRIRLLDNGGATVDASSLSFDHAVALDPLVAERIELLHGPAALLYGGNATGGVVNSIDNRIPRVAAAEALSGRAEVRLGGAADERSGALVLDGGQGGLAWHADAFGRRTSDLRTPRFVPTQNGQALPAADRVRNSAAEGSGGAVGLSAVDDRGYLGLSVDGYRNRYGVTVEPDVLIDLRRERVALAGERRRLDGWFDQVSLNASATRYRHQELEGNGEVGTTFSSRGEDFRLQARHVALGPWRGVLGVQAEGLRFSALGEEAFVPGTRTRSQAAFWLEEAQFGPWALQAGLRGERVRIDSDGDAEADTPRFGAAQSRRFSPASASLAATWQLGKAWSLAFSAGHTERAPAFYELYANGLHVATAAFERGDPTLGLERSGHLGAGLAWQRGPDHLKLNVYRTRFSRFISLAASGETAETDDGEPVPVYRFEPVRARFQGVELEGRWRALQQPWRLDLSLVADAVRATDVDSGQPLPRIAPARLQLGADLAQGPWTLGLGLRHAARQNRVSPDDEPTPSSTVWNLWASWRLPLAQQRITAFLRLDNLSNQLVYNATAVPTIRGLAPQGGRALTAGLRVEL
jgi:iron complex outermembrane receptor protein